MFITAVGTAQPENKYTQLECWEAISRSSYLARLNSRSQAILRKVLTSENGISTRHFAMTDLQEAFVLDPGTLHQRFATAAPKLAAQAAAEALKEREIKAEELDALIICTCTGYLCPGLTSYVSECLGLRSDVFLMDLVGQGCGAALPAMNAGHALLHSGQAERVLVIAVEVCSAAFYLDNDPGVLISACLFGDGAGAVILERRAPLDRKRVHWKDFATCLDPQNRNLLRFEMREGMLRNVLDKSVPLLVVEQLREILKSLEKRSDFQQEKIQQWILHAGGRDVLCAVEKGLSVPPGKLQWSAEVLHGVGNVSSPSVIFALQRALTSNAAGGCWFMAAFGAGISCHGVILDVEE